MKTLNLDLSIPQHQMDIENGGVLRRVLSEERERERSLARRSDELRFAVPVVLRRYCTGIIDLDQIDLDHKLYSDTESLRTIQYEGPCSMQ